jgi:hypothetical protein
MTITPEEVANYCPEDARNLELANHWLGNEQWMTITPKELKELIETKAQARKERDVLKQALDSVSNWLVCLYMCDKEEIMEEALRQNNNIEQALASITLSSTTHSDKPQDSTQSHSQQQTQPRA